MSLESNIKKYYVYSVTSYALFIAPIFTLFFMALGYSLFTTALVTSTLFYLTWVIFNIPTGIFADIYGRRKTLIIASCLVFIGGVLVIFSKPFFLFVLAWFLIGLGASFNTGASSALIYDTLIKLKREDEFKRIQGRALFYAHLALGITALIGAYTYTINIRIPFILAACNSLVALIYSFKFEESYTPTKESSFLKKFKESIYFSWKNKKIRWIIFYDSLIISVYFVFFRNLIQPYLISTGLEIASFGLFFALFRFISAIGSNFSHKVENRIGEYGLLFIMPLLFSIIFLLMGKYISFIGIIFLSVMFLIVGSYLPVVEGFINKHSHTEKRATILSIRSMTQYLFQAFLIIGLVFISEKFGMNIMLYSSSAFLFLMTIIFFKTADRS